MPGFKHRVTVEHMEAGTPDAEGRNAAKVKSTLCIRARVAPVRSMEANHGDKYGEQIKSVMTCSAKTVISDNDKVIVRNIHPSINGDYWVETVNFAGPVLEIPLRVTDRKPGTF